MWDSFQRRRLEFEAEVLADNHPHCDFVLEDFRATARIWHHVAGSWYRLRVEVPGMYPDEKPHVYIEQPVPLPAYWAGRMIAEFAPSHNYHILSTSALGEVQICHFSSERWDAEKTRHLVVLKAKLWLQAYAEHHLRTGKPICDFFSDCI